MAPLLYTVVVFTALLSFCTSDPSPLTSLSLTLIDDASFNFQLLVLLGGAVYHGADIGDVLAAAKVLEPGSFFSYNTTFYDLATQAHAAADAAVARENGTLRGQLNARDTYFKAASYYRNADFYLHGNWTDPKINSYWDQQLTCFNKAIAALPVPGERVTIPAGNFSTIGIFYAYEETAINTQPRPTLLVGNGYDAAQEDSFHTIGAAALERGWNVMTYEGPGQPTVRREQDIGFIYDWERVVTPAVDYLASRPDVDMSRLALMGISLGGYLAGRAAAFEPRVKAVILDDGILDAQAGFFSQFGPQAISIFETGNQTYFDAIIDAAVINNSSATSAARWGIEQGLWSFKTHSTYDFLERTGLYTVANLTDRLQDRPVWIGNAADDVMFPGQALALANALGGNATLVNFTGPASYHCEVGASEQANREIFGWLNGVFGEAA